MRTAVRRHRDLLAAWLVLVADALACYVFAVSIAMFACAPSAGLSEPFLDWVVFVEDTIWGSLIFGAWIWSLAYPWTLMHLGWARSRAHAVVARAAFAAGAIWYLLVAAVWLFAFEAWVLSHVLAGLAWHELYAGPLNQQEGVSTLRRLALGLCLLAVLMLAPPFWRRWTALRRRLEAVAEALPICRVCGYSVAPRQRCPECGRINAVHPELRPRVQAFE